MLVATLAALSFMAMPRPTSDRVTLVGAFYEHRYCRTWEDDGYCPCADGSSPTYWVEGIDGNRRRVILDAEIMDQYFGPGAIAGKFVRIRGQAIPGEEDIVRMKSLEVLRAEFVSKCEDPEVKALRPFFTAPQSTYQLASTEVRKYINLAIKFKESATEQYPAPYYVEIMRSSYPGLDHWVRETSYNQVGIACQGFGWITLPKAKESYLQDNEPEWDMTKILADVVPMIDNQVNFNTVWGVNIFVNLDPPTGGGAYASWARVQADGLDKWFPTTLQKPGAHSQALLCHEDGHNFGNDHSSGPYNTPYDSMWDANSGGYYSVSSGFGYGNDWIGIPYNAYHKKLLGWIPRERVYYAYPGSSQTVYIDRLTEPSSTDSYLMAKIFLPGYSTKYFTVESRKKIGYDAGIPGEGVIIHDCDELRKYADDYGFRYDRASQVVDATNDNNPNDAGAIWVAGEEYTHSSSGIKIKVISSTPTGYNVQITVPPLNWTPGEVKATGTAGPYTLREALRYVQEFPEQPVRFRIPTSDPGFSSGVAKITLTEPLQDIITNGLVLDGTTQTTNVGNTNPNGPEIYIDGSGIVDDQNQPRFAHGLVVKAKDVTLKGVGIGNFYASGIWASSSATTNFKVAGCFLGLHPNGSTLVGNGWDGITLADGASNCVVGGTAVTERNVISGNGSGVVLQDPLTTTNRVIGNYIGLNFSGALEKRNLYDAVRIGQDAHHNDVGGLATGERNVIVGTVTLRDSADDNHILGNYIGTNAAGTVALNQSGGWGIALRYGVARTLIRGNVISGNSDVGVGVGEAGAVNTQVVGNFIGTNPSGSAAVPNGKGIFVFGGASSTQIGTSATADRNIISGNGTAISIYDSPNTKVQGNYIGLNATGTAGLPQSDWAIVQWGTGATGTLIGGSNPGQGNYVAGNTTIAIGIRNGQAAIKGNTIGLTPSGASMGNTIGVHLDQGAHDCVVGGLGLAGNVVAYSSQSAIVIRDSGTERNVLHGNYIGVDRNLAPKPNAGTGVWILLDASHNVIGGTGSGEGNVIANNGSYGIAVDYDGTKGNSIRGNRTYGNAQLGINLWGGTGWGGGITPNDSLDADTGPNDLQNFPELGSASRTSTGTTVAGWLYSKASKNYAVDIYVSDDVDPSGNGEGQRYLGTTSVTTNGSGFATFTLNAGVATGSWVSATATDVATGDTSEFGQAIGLPNGVVGLTVTPGTVDNGQSATGTVTLGAMAPAGGSAVSLTSNRTTVKVPASVTVASGQFAANFTVTTLAVTTNTTATISASLNGLSKSAVLIVKATAFLQSFVVTPLTIKGGASATGTVTLSAAAATGGLSVSLSDPSAYVTMPATVVIAAGTSSKSFTITTVNPPSNQTVVLTAALGTVTKTQTVVVTRQPKLTGFTVLPASVIGGNSATGTVTIDMAAPTGGTPVAISESAWSITAPPIVTVAAGTTSKAFSIPTSAVTAAQSHVITATLSGSTKTASLTLLPAVYLVSLTITPSTVKGGTSATGRVTLNAGAPPAGATVTIWDNLASVGTPATVYVSPGSLTKTFTITTPTVSQTYVCTVTATYVGITKTATLTMTP